MTTPSVPDRAERLTTALLRQWPLPMPDSDGDKEARGRVLIIGGSVEIPGSVLLAANAAFRAGAGKVTIATGRSIALTVAMAVPETRVIGLPETATGGLDPDSADTIRSAAARADAILIGPGMQDSQDTSDFARILLQRLEPAKVILDALAMDAIGDGALQERGMDLLLTPHAGEMARLTGLTRERIAGQRPAVALEFARKWGAAGAVKGATTCIATSAGRLLIHEGGNPGLAVSGSGDCLAGIVVALAARGASVEQACAWSVVLHALAGQRLRERCGALGFLARELPAEVPGLLQSLT